LAVQSPPVEHWPKPISDPGRRSGKRFHTTSDEVQRRILLISGNGDASARSNTLTGLEAEFVQRLDAASRADPSREAEVVELGDSFNAKVRPGHGGRNVLEQTAGLDAGPLLATENREAEQKAVEGGVSDSGDRVHVDSEGIPAGGSARSVLQLHEHGIGDRLADLGTLVELPVLVRREVIDHGNGLNRTGTAQLRHEIRV
jgi:hypothetical protein